MFGNYVTGSLTQNPIDQIRFFLNFFCTILNFISVILIYFGTNFNFFGE